MHPSIERTTLMASKFLIVLDFVLRFAYSRPSPIDELDAQPTQQIALAKQTVYETREMTSGT